MEVTELDLRDLGPDESGRTVFQLLEDFTVKVPFGDRLFEITVPAGFKTDFASIPRRIPLTWLPKWITRFLPTWLSWLLLWGIPLWSIFPPWGKHNKAAVVHDFLYRKGLFSRFFADAIFRYMMAEASVVIWKRLIIFYAVRLGGRKAWKGGSSDIDGLVSVSKPEE